MNQKQSAAMARMRAAATEMIAAVEDWEEAFDIPPPPLVLEPRKPRPRMDPDKMHGAGDGFGGSDYL